MGSRPEFVAEEGAIEAVRLPVDDVGDSVRVAAVVGDAADGSPATADVPGVPETAEPLSDAEPTLLVNGPELQPIDISHNYHDSREDTSSERTGRRSTCSLRSDSSHTSREQFHSTHRKRMRTHSGSCPL